MSDFTKAETRAIRRAFEAIERHLERIGFRFEYDWKEAFKAERKQCSNSDWARALMVEAFANGVRKPLGAADLFGIRPGLRTAHIIGAAALARTHSHRDQDGAAIARQWLLDDFSEYADAAKTAQHAARERRFDVAGKGA